MFHFLAKKIKTEYCCELDMSLYSDKNTGFKNSFLNRRLGMLYMDGHIFRIDLFLIIYSLFYTVG